MFEQEGACMAHSSPIAAGFGLVAALSMAAPVQAADLPQQIPASGSSLALMEGFSTGTYDAKADVSNWRRCRWRGCHRRGWRRGRRGVSAGDVLAGAVIIGGIAAIASAASNNRRDRERERYRDVRDDRRDNPRRSTNRSSGSGIDNAVSQCLNVIERDVRVENVDNATRGARGWVVSGRIFDGSSFTCEIGNDGRISDITYGRFSRSDVNYSSGPGTRAAGQLSDDRYADARAALPEQVYSTDQRFAEANLPEPQPLVPLTSDRLPAYPGGPLPGEE